MRILLITQWFQPEATFMGLPFARELSKRGHTVQVLTGFPNYPGGVVYDGYRIRPLQKENIDNISIVRVPLYPSHNNSAMGRIANYTTFAMAAALIGPWVIKPADIAYVYHPPATIGFPACVFRLVRNIPFVYNIEDLWPDTLQTTGMFTNPLGIWLVDKWCRFVYHHASKIVVISPGFKQKLCERGVPENKIEVIYNWCENIPDKNAPKNEQLSQELKMAERFNIVYAGNIGYAQALEAVLDAAQLVASRYPQVQFIFVGGGVDVESLKTKAVGMGLTNVIFLARRPVKELDEILRLADVLLVHLKDVPLFRITIPGKTQANMAAGKPILMGVRGDASDLVLKANAGIVCEPENPHSIAEAVEKLFLMPKAKLEQMGANGRAFYEQQLSLEIGTSRFEKIFEEVARKQQ